MHARRGRGVVRLCADTAAGIIASSSGKAITLPPPRRKWRRDKCFFVRKFMSTLLSSSTLGLCGRLGLDDAHAERCAFDDTEHDIGKSVVVCRRASGDLAYRRHVG